MDKQLSGSNTAVALLVNTLATGTGLIVLILTFGPISGVHFNPAVTLADTWHGGLSWGDVPPYLLAQVFSWLLPSEPKHVTDTAGSVPPL